MIVFELKIIKYSAAKMRGVRAMSRDLQVRVVVCHWLAWLLRIKRPAEHDAVMMESVVYVDKQQSQNHTANNHVVAEDASPTGHRRLTHHLVCTVDISL